MQITDRGITCIVAKCRKLKELGVAYDQQLSPHVLGTYHYLKDVQVSVTPLQWCLFFWS
jgi:hypothetical protein